MLSLHSPINHLSPSATTGRIRGRGSEADKCHLSSGPCQKGSIINATQIHWDVPDHSCKTQQNRGLKPHPGYPAQTSSNYTHHCVISSCFTSSDPRSAPSAPPPLPWCTKALPVLHISVLDPSQMLDPSVHLLTGYFHSLLKLLKMLTKRTF